MTRKKQKAVPAPPTDPNKYPVPEHIEMGMSVIARRWYHDDPDMSYQCDELATILGFYPQSIYNVRIRWTDGDTACIEAKDIQLPERAVAKRTDPVHALATLADMIKEPRRYRGSGF